MSIVFIIFFVLIIAFLLVRKQVNTEKMHEQFYRDYQYLRQHSLTFQNTMEKHNLHWDTHKKMILKALKSARNNLKIQAELSESRRNKEKIQNKLSALDNFQYNNIDYLLELFGETDSLNYAEIVFKVEKKFVKVDEVFNYIKELENNLCIIQSNSQRANYIINITSLNHPFKKDSLGNPITIDITEYRNQEKKDIWRR